ncbi:MAG: hypothetical protein AB7V26_15735 [Lysobacterales bacterium]
MTEPIEKSFELRRFTLGEEPSMVEEYRQHSPAQRLAAWLELRHGLLENPDGTEQRLARVFSVARIG